LHIRANGAYGDPVTLRTALAGDGCSLRDRKREETRRALVDAAYALVRDLGHAELTAEGVADRAGVSRRTFFNYFPSVESVLTASVAEFFASVGDRLDARPGDEDVLDSALAVVSDPGDVDLVERIGVLAAAGEASPQARGLILVELHTWLDWLEGWLRGRLGPVVPDLYVATLASTLVGAAEAAFRVWLRGTAPTPDAGGPASGDLPADAGAGVPASTALSLQHSLAAAIDLVRTGLDPQRVTVAARSH
jgi:AcrR family transcriptional regulator